jgi:hypothetical protein
VELLVNFHAEHAKKTSLRDPLLEIQALPSAAEANDGEILGASCRDADAADEGFWLCI